MSKQSCRILFVFVLGLSFLAIPLVQAANTHSVDLESGSGQYFSITDAAQTDLDLSSDFTLETWIKLESVPTSGNYYSIIGKWDDTGNNRQYVLNYENNSGVGALRIYTSSDGTNNENDAVSYTLSTGTWYHVAITKSGTSATFYINGSSIGSVSFSNGAIYNGGAHFTVGAIDVQATARQLFDGLIDDVRVWNVARSAQEVADDMDTELNGNEVGLVGYWKFNNSLADLSANGNTLTNNGSAVFSTDTGFAGFVESLVARKTVNEEVVNSTILQDDEELTLNLSANKTYIIEGVIFASSTSASPDLKIAFTGQSNTGIRIGYTNDVNEMVLDSGDESNRITLPANIPTSVHIKGTVVTSNSGTFKLKWAQVTSNAAPTTIMAGSYLRAQEI